MYRLAFRYTEWDYSGETSFEHSIEDKVKFETGSTANWQPWAASAQIHPALKLLRNLRLRVYRFSCQRLAGVTDGNDLISVGRLWDKKLQDWAPDTHGFKWENCNRREEKKNTTSTPPPKLKPNIRKQWEGFPLYLCHKVDQLLMTRWSVRLLYRRRQGHITASKPFPSKKHYKHSTTSSASMIQASE